MSEWAHEMKVSMDVRGRWWVHCACGTAWGSYANEDDADDQALNHRDDMETP